MSMKQKYIIWLVAFAFCLVTVQFLSSLLYVILSGREETKKSNMNIGTVLNLIVLVILIPLRLAFSFPQTSKHVGLFTPKRIRIAEAPVVTLIVEIPTSSVQYAKPLDVRTGGKFYLETPMEHYAYSSSGRSNLHRVKVIYLMQSMYRANLMCFFLHFWSKKDPTVPWNVPHARVPPPPWFGKHNTGLKRFATY